MRLSLYCAFLLCSPLLSSCGLYVHSARLQTQTEALQKSVKGLNAPDYLASQGKHLDESSKREDLALTRYLVASRDVSLLNIVRPPVASAKARPTEDRLMTAISFEVDVSAGKAFVDASEIKALETAPFRQTTLERAVSFYESQRGMVAAKYKAAGGTAQTDCNTVMTIARVPGDRSALAGLYQNLRQVCAAWDARAAAEPDCAVGVTTGDIAEVCADIAALKSEELSSLRNKQLAGAMTAIQSRVAKHPPAATQKIADAIKSIENLVADFKGAPTNDDYKKVFDAISSLLALDLTEALNDALKKGEDVKLDKISNFMKELLPAIDASVELQAPDGDPLDQPSAILIGVAKLRHELNLVKLEIDERTQKSALLDQQAEALRAQLHFLARAQVAICRPPAGGNCQPSTDIASRGEALAYYINSFNLGRIPYEVLHFRELQLHRSTVLKQAQITEADYRALIQPAIDQIAAYGAGGVDPELLGPFLASLPVTGAIIAK